MPARQLLARQLGWHQRDRQLQALPLERHQTSLQQLGLALQQVSRSRQTGCRLLEREQVLWRQRGRLLLEQLQSQWRLGQGRRQRGHLLLVQLRVRLRRTSRWRLVLVLRRLEGAGILDAYPALAAYIARGQARPAYRRAFAAQLAVFEDGPAKGWPLPFSVTTWTRTGPRA